MIASCFPQSIPITREISDSANIIQSTCDVHPLSLDGRRALFGLEVNNCIDSMNELGVYVVGYFSVRDEVPALVAGIDIGSRIISVRGCRINNSADLRKVIKETAPGSAVFVEIKQPNANKNDITIVRTLEYMPVNEAKYDWPSDRKCSTIGLKQAK